MAEFTLQPNADYQSEISANVAQVAREQNLPAPFVEQLVAAIADAAQKSFEAAGHADGEGVTVAVQLRQSAPQQAGQCWGFFLVRKSAGIPARPLIEVTVYEDQS
jgi:hypothetical protein